MENTTITGKAYSAEVEITARAKAYSRQGVQNHRFLVRGDEVKVWDPVAGHYTNCHAMSTATLARIAKLATEQPVYSGPDALARAAVSQISRGAFL